MNIEKVVKSLVRAIGFNPKKVIFRSKNDLVIDSDATEIELIGCQDVTINNCPNLRHIRIGQFNSGYLEINIQIPQLKSFYQETGDVTINAELTRDLVYEAMYGNMDYLCLYSYDSGLVVNFPSNEEYPHIYLD